MKRIYLYLFALITSAAVTSCSLRKDNEFEDAVDTSGLWNKNVNITLKDVSGSFSVAKDMKTGDETVLSSQKRVEIAVKTADNSKIATIDMYVFMSEEGGLNSASPFSEPVKFKTFAASEMDVNGKILVDIDAADLISLFGSALTKDRSVNPIWAGDLFETYWVITGTDGLVYDSRKKVGDYSSILISVKVDKDLAPFGGSFDYEWTYLTADGSYYGRVNVGDKGVMVVEPATYSNGVGTFSVKSNFSFGYNYGSKTGTLEYDYATDKVTVKGGQSEEWNIKYIDTKTIEIIWMYYYTDSYNEWGKVTLKRKDGRSWSPNINSSTKVPN